MVRDTIEQVLAETETIGITVLLSEEGLARERAEEALAPPSGQPGAATSSDDLAASLDLMGDGLFYELGLGFRVREPASDHALTLPWFKIRWNDVTSPPLKGLQNDEILVSDTTDRLTLLNIKGRQGRNPVTGAECAIVNVDGRAICEAAGLTTWTPSGYAVLCASAIVRRHAGAFMTANVTAAYSSTLSESFPDLVDHVGNTFEDVDVTRILRLLLDEEISIRDLRNILEALLAVNAVTWADPSEFIIFAPDTGLQCIIAPGRTRDELRAADYCDAIRTAMRAYLGHKYTRGGNTLVYLLSPVIERRIVGTGGLSPGERRQLLDAVWNEVGDLPPTARIPVILTTNTVRRPLRELIAREFPQVAVLSYQELSPEMNIQPIARIDW